MAIQEVAPLWQKIIKSVLPDNWLSVESPLGMILWDAHRLELNQPPVRNALVFPDIQDKDNRRRNFRTYLQARGGKPHHSDLRNTCHCRVCSAMRN